MQLAHKFRLYPTKEQEKKLLCTLERCRFVYNYLLEQKTKHNLKRKELQALLPKLKKEHPNLQNIYSKVLQYENYRLHSNIMALHKLKTKGKKIGRLRFKGKGWFKTFVYNQSGFKIIERNRRYEILHLSKIGDIPFLKHRKIEGKIKQVVIKHQPSGRWFASIISEIKTETGKPKGDKKVGIDLGLDNFVYDSTGNGFKAPKSLDKSLDKLRMEQRRLSRKKKGTKNRARQRIKVAKVHERIVNQRDDFLHKLSRYYVDTYGFIAYEDLNIKGMVRNHYLARSIMDASWLRFIHMLEYKAESAGVQVMKVEAKETTQRCSRCGNLVKKGLAVRVHKCPFCGLQIGRDYNSAINILKRSLGQELSEYTPVETEPLPARASLVIETGSPMRNVG
jgi:putative transposase